MWPVRHGFLLSPKILMTEEGRKFAIIPLTSSSAVILENRCFKMLNRMVCNIQCKEENCAFKVCILLFICQ